MEDDDIKKDKPLSKIAKEGQRTTEETSFGKDLFIIAGGITFVILIFFLYRTLAGFDLNVKFSRLSNSVVDTQGNPLDNSDKAVDPQLIRRFFRIGFICAAVGILVFLFFSILLKWPKYIRRRPVEQKEGESDSESSTGPP